MYTEALFWIGLILASPALFMCSKMLTIWVMGFFVSDDVLELTLENESGDLITERVSLDSTDELIQIIDEITASSHNGGGATYDQ